MAVKGTGFSCLSQAHLALDLLGCVSEEDGRVGVTGAHLGLSTLQGREEGGMQQGRFRVADPGCHVPCHSEVRVLGGEGLGEDNGQPQRSAPSWEAVKPAVSFRLTSLNTYIPPPPSSGES